MSFIVAAFEMLGLASGTVVYGFIAFLFLRKHPARSSAVEWTAFVGVCAAFLWYAAWALGDLVNVVVTDAPPANLAPVLHLIEWLGLAILPAAAVSLGLTFHSRRGGLAIWVLVPLAWWTLTIGNYPFLFGAAFAAAVALLLLRSGSESHLIAKQFRPIFALALIVAAAGAAFGPASGLRALGGLAPGACLLFFIHRYQLLGRVIGRRLLFAAALGGISAVYLLVAHSIAEWAQREFDAFGPVLEVLLILAGVTLGFPLYGWMNRVLSKRTQIYSEFGKRLSQDAAGILDLQQYLEYVSREVGRTFQPRRALLAAVSGSERRAAAYGPPDIRDSSVNLPLAAEGVRAARLDAVVDRYSEGALLNGTGFNFLFPLWYDSRLVGLLFLDTSPRDRLDDNDEILWGLCQQIAHGIDTCNLIQHKIDLEKALARSEHMAALGQMAATVAHEVKNPLSSIKTLAQLMEEDVRLSDERRRDLSYIVSEADRLDSCVQQLLTFARPPSEDRREVVVADLLEKISRVMNQEYAQSQVRIEFRVTEDLVLKNMDPQSLHQIVLNLTLNAVQASSPDDTVELRAACNGDGKAVITVTDNGAGVPEEIRGKVFEPFFTTKLKGSGLGLAIVSKNVRHLGGEIHLDSPVSHARGTRVTVTLPVEAA